MISEMVVREQIPQNLIIFFSLRREVSLLLFFFISLMSYTRVLCGTYMRHRADVRSHRVEMMVAEQR